jgi:hypothetical protein
VAERTKTRSDVKENYLNVTNEQVDKFLDTVDAETLVNALNRKGSYVQDPPPGPVSVNRVTPEILEEQSQIIIKLSGLTLQDALDLARINGKLSKVTFESIFK